MIVLMAIALIACFVSGCSTFFTHNTDGAPITCRNYDCPHRVSKEDRSLTGLNAVLHCKPEGKYESIAVADAVCCLDILDDCANVEEVVQKTKTGILLPEDWQDCHLMVTDAAGSSVVIESRNSEISVIPSDICTNFYLAVPKLL